MKRKEVNIGNYKISSFNVQSIEKVKSTSEIKGFTLFISPCSLIFLFTFQKAGKITYVGFKRFVICNAKQASMPNLIF